MLYGAGDKMNIHRDMYSYMFIYIYIQLIDTCSISLDLEQ